MGFGPKWGPISRVADPRNSAPQLVHFGTRMNASCYGVKRSKFKVTVESSMLENALFHILLFSVAIAVRTGFQTKLLD